jgi:hypothetical protein
VEADPVQRVKGRAGYRQEFRVEDAAAGEKPCLLLPGGETGCAALADVDFLPVFVPEDIGLDLPWGNEITATRLPPSNSISFIKRQHHRMDFGAEDGVQSITHSSRLGR